MNSLQLLANSEGVYDTMNATLGATNLRLLQGLLHKRASGRLQRTTVENSASSTAAKGEEHPEPWGLGTIGGSYVYSSSAGKGIKRSNPPWTMRPAKPWTGHATKIRNGNRGGYPSRPTPAL